MLIPSQKIIKIFFASIHKIQDDNTVSGKNQRISIRQEDSKKSMRYRNL
jgi:hypothetical protein